MNWYKKAEEWHKFTPTITLYHGTNDNILNKILKNGFIPVKPDLLVEQILNKYNLTKKDIPEYIWKGEYLYRKEKPYLHFTTSKEQAKSYAKSSILAGEFEGNILRLLRAWLKQNKKINIEIPEYKPIIITIDVPWEKVKSHKSMSELKEIVQNVLKSENDFLMEGETVNDFLNNLEFEFMISEPLSKEFIKKYELV
jgi:hypothetical protein